MSKKDQKKERDILQTPKGTRDLLPKDVAVWEFVEAKCREIADYYGFRPIRTPHFEKTELFASTVGASTDIIEKQMYVFRTRGGDSLALRPEGTAPLMRAYIQHGMHTWSQPVMLSYGGSFFRHESPQKGRWREFGQFGLEIIGTDTVAAEVLIIRTFLIILVELGIKNLNVHINTLGDKECRQAYRKELVGYYRRKVNYLCKNCRRRLKTNPLRLLDCKEEKCQELQEGAPQIIEYICDGCKAHFRDVLEFLDKLDVSYFLNHRLVRGLDYYSRTVFEIFSEDEPIGQPQSGAQEGAAPEDITDSGKIADGGEDKKDMSEKEHTPSFAIGGGGRYDYLAERFGVRDLEHPARKGAAGGALGIDRIVEILVGKKLNAEKKEKPKAFLIQLGPQAKQQSLLLLEEFRKSRVLVASSLAKDNLKNQLKLAAQIGVPYALILGQKEAIDGTIIVRDMSSGIQETIPQIRLLDYLKKLGKNK